MIKERFVVVGAHTIKDTQTGEHLDLEECCELLNRYNNSYEVLKQAYKLACNAVVAEHLPYAEIEEFKVEAGMESVGIDNEDTESYFIYLADKEINGE